MNDTIILYNQATGYGIIGTLSFGRWKPGGFNFGLLALPKGHTHAAASADSLVLYNFRRRRGLLTGHAERPQLQRAQGLPP
ncbi:hypothetical protein ACFVZW_36665, partial [Streptomyces sp. NPDC059567]|uniref:hypothetical protein n=1 Tax=Streptomyces sp. NPDC059567 TaxID=3346867 RepID=UPI0036A9F4A6